MTPEIAPAHGTTLAHVAEGSVRPALHGQLRIGNACLAIASFPFARRLALIRQGFA